MVQNESEPNEKITSPDIKSPSTMNPTSGSSSSSGLAGKGSQEENAVTDSNTDLDRIGIAPTDFERGFHAGSEARYNSMGTRSKRFVRTTLKRHFGPGGKLRPFRLLRQDIRNIRRRYISDWKLFNQLVFASAVYVFFTNILPGITFASDLYVLTGKTWGTIEVVFSTGLCGIIFSILSIQPLTILGVTGPFAVLAENIYELCESSFHVDFLALMAWSLIHVGWMHYLLAIFNAHDWTMQYVTTFSADIFSLLNSVIYFHKAVQELQRNHEAVSFASFLYSVIGAIGTFLLAVFLSTANSWKPLFHRYVRMGLSEYAAAISIILFIGMPNIGELAALDKQTLCCSNIISTFGSESKRAIITILFYFDHEISSIICTLDRYGTKKPGGFAWDIVLLGTTTAICGILGIPPANGLLPQAPLHSESLMHTIKEESLIIDDETGERIIKYKEHDVVHEQRWSHFLQAGGILVFISPPFQHVLGLTPTSVLAGLFLFMGEQSLAVNPILFRFFHMLTPPSELPPLPKGVKNYWGVHGYTALQIAMTGIIFYVTLTVAAPAFPVIVIALVPARLLVMNRIWGRETLRFVDEWACKDGTPEDDEDRKNGVRDEIRENKVEEGERSDGKAGEECV